MNLNLNYKTVQHVGRMQYRHVFNLRWVEYIKERVDIHHLIKLGKIFLTFMAIKKDKKLKM